MSYCRERADAVVMTRLIEVSMTRFNVHGCKIDSVFGSVGVQYAQDPG